jgi:hypothetical protein
MKNLAMSLTFAAAAGAAQALPPVLGPATLTTNLAVGALGPVDQNGRITLTYNPSGGQIVGGPNPRDISQGCIGSFVNCFSEAMSYATAVPGPSASAMATYNVNGQMPPDVTLLNPTQVGANVSVTLQYQFSVNGPAGSTAFVDLASFMQASGQYGPALTLASFAGFRVDAPGAVWVSTYLYAGNSNPTLQRNIRDLQGNLTFTSVPSPGTGQYLENEVVPFAANTAYTVYLYANASATQQVVTGSNGGGGTAMAFVDPQLTIDPMTPNASNYWIEFSTGIGNAAPVPEPATAWTLAMGLGCLVWHRRSLQVRTIRL